MPAVVDFKEQLREIQDEVLAAMAHGQALAAVLDLLCRRVEALAPDITCSILRIDRDLRIRPLAGPSLPPTLSQAIDGLRIGPDVGSCGTAAFLGEPVAVEDIETDPLWARYRHLVLPMGLRACWSSPIRIRNDRVAGTFGFYARTRRGPTEIEILTARTCVHLCAVALDHDEALNGIQQLAYFDPLTGLPNRTYFQQCTSEIDRIGKTDGKLIAFHCVDLNDFKGVNDTLGHDAGDQVLREVGRRLLALAKGATFVARLGGDEFIVVQIAACDHDITELANRLIAAIDRPFELADHILAVRASIGIAFIEIDRYDAADLMKQADLALYQAKRDAQGSYRLFDPPMLEAVLARRSIEQGLHRADFDREFSLAFQPIVSLANGAITGAEVLLRWQHPCLGNVPPSVFIPVAEQGTIICTIGDAVMERALRAAADWPRHVTLAVNVSPRQLKQPGFAAHVLARLARHGFAPTRLELEITETALFQDAAASYAALKTLSGAGIRIALDDFGTGYSSLSHLRNFPIDKLKIDRSFVQDLPTVADSTAIVGAVLRLARDLGIKTTAEGVETDAQRDWLVAAGCTEAQGYYFSRPVPLATFEALLDPGKLAGLSLAAQPVAATRATG